MNAARRGGKSMPDLVTEAFTICARHWRSVFAVAAIPAVLSGLASLAGSAGYGAIGIKSVQSTSTSTGDTFKAIGVLTATLVVTLILYLATQVLLFPLVKEASLGRKPRPGVRRPGLSAALARTVVVGVVVGVGLVALSLTGFGIPVAIFLAVRWSFTGQCLATEGRPPFAAMRRSWAVVSGAWWRVGLITLAIAFLGLIPRLALIPIGQLANNVGVDVIVYVAGSVLSVPFVAVATILLYIDVLARKGEQAQPAAPAE